jgi:hypothetical protein
LVPFQKERSQKISSKCGRQDVAAVFLTISTIRQTKRVNQEDQIKEKFQIWEKKFEVEIYHLFLFLKH